ncbi:dienelactone hydrolase family protein [Sphingomonas sp. HDW15A]|uniref:dienelactone hydrolase family protein n=1 Tax=Sphingomonas sp. HDW15A TaxID=2714942 RepID=UPI00140737A7|nr:dienelactone hydrolase family protein [Sphingomonas sp. HDW15A]QIK95541.1 dienelactone hydrolase family protein [Sphingomonas sp. HDW15A]
MIDQDKRQEAILLYDRFTHEGLDRRDFMTRMTAIAGSAAAAELLIAGIAASPAAAAIVPANDKRLTTRTMTFSEGAARGYKAYVAEPRTRSLKPSVLVIHENRGLNDYTRDVARRLAVAGFRGVAADFLSASGGTPANEDKAREMIGKLDLGAVTAAGAAMVRELAKSSRGGKVGAVGFCWGGAFINRLAVLAGKDLDAGVSYYGTAPSPAEAAKVQSPLLIHLAGLDERVNRSAYPWVKALRAAKKPVEYHGYAGVNHAFHNDTSAERYAKAAAELSWERTIRFFKRYLG